MDATEDKDNQHWPMGEAWYESMPVMQQEQYSWAFLPTVPPSRHDGDFGVVPSSMEGLQSLYESDDSWTLADHEEEWQHFYHEQLTRLLADDERYTFITPLLDSKHRRRLHAMAHLRRLSHMSLGSGKAKRILITKCEINTSATCRNRWNSRRGHLMAGVIDPHIVTFSCEKSAVDLRSLRQYLQDVGLPPPLHLEHEHYLDSHGPPRLSSDIRALFEDPVHAATIYAALQPTETESSFLRALLGSTRCAYTLFVACSWDAHSTITSSITFASIRTSNADQTQNMEGPCTQSLADKPESPIASLIDAAAGIRHTCETCGAAFPDSALLKRHERSHVAEKPFVCLECRCCFARADLLFRHRQHLHGNAGTADEDLGMDPTPRAGIPVRHDDHSGSCAVDESNMGTSNVRAGSTSAQQPAELWSDISSSSSHSLSNAVNHNDGLMTAVSSNASLSSMVLSDYGSDVSLAKRKRLPVGTYECAFRCGKSFSHSGHRTKHEKIHQVGRPHPCQVCGYGFMYPKDLRRHQRRTGHEYSEPNAGTNPAQSTSNSRVSESGLEDPSSSASQVTRKSMMDTAAADDMPVSTLTVDDVDTFPDALWLTVRRHVPRVSDDDANMNVND